MRLEKAGRQFAARGRMERSSFLYIDWPPPSAPGRTNRDGQTADEDRPGTKLSGSSFIGTNDR
jgi:hypothetical protein